jgi:FKBP-type peptidyl-prolyl cis-trans isomerase
MKKYVVAPALAVAFVACTTGAQTGKAVKLENEKNKVSFAIGHQIGSDFKTRGIEVDFDALTYGLREGMEGKASPISQEDTQKLFQGLQTSMRAKAESENAAKAKANVEAGKKYLEENKKKDGVKTTASGLQYKVVTEGKGPMPKATDMVSVHYKGTLIDGTEFDSSIKRGEPATFPVNGVIKGWTEALQLMPVGSKWQLVIPADIAYGERGAGPQIGPNATLLFEVELLEIKNPEQPKKIEEGKKAEEPKKTEPAKKADEPKKTEPAKKK